MNLHETLTYLNITNMRGLLPTSGDSTTSCWRLLSRGRGQKKSPVPWASTSYAVVFQTLQLPLFGMALSQAFADFRGMSSSSLPKGKCQGEVSQGLKTQRFQATTVGIIWPTSPVTWSREWASFAHLFQKDFDRVEGDTNCRLFSFKCYKR